MSARALKSGYMGVRIWSPKSKAVHPISCVRFCSDNGSSKYNGFGNGSNGSKPSYDSMFKNASESSLPGIDAMPYIQGFQGREHEFAKLRTRNMNRAGEESDICQSGDGNLDGLSKDPYNHCYQSMSNVSLHGVMQTNVPEPYTKSPGHMNMPGGGVKLQDKITSGKLHDTHYSNLKGNRSFSTSTIIMNTDKDGPQGVQGPFPWLEEHTVESLSQQENPVPQGIQGMDCDKFRLWLANCTKYNIIECDQQLVELREGRKTLAEIFEEQEKMIQDVANQYQSKVSDGQRS